MARSGWQAMSMAGKAVDGKACDDEARWSLQTPALSHQRRFATMIPEKRQDDAA
jgi:hypothetical protein